MAVLGFIFSAMLVGQVVAPARAEETTTFPDLEPVFMLFDPPFPSVNENVTIVAHVINNGTADVFGVKVSFFVNSSYIGYNTTSVLAGFLNETSISWTPDSLGTYNITAVVDPSDEIAESNETNNALSELVLAEAEWLVEGTGTNFETTNSEYLNITLTSSETVHVILESVPRIINFIVERNSSATSTVLTLSGFEPDTTYYRYQDGDLMANFTSDSEGGYTYTQDISEPHHVFIQEETSTLYIDSDYTFTTDIYETIVITANNTVIDGNGYALQGPGYGNGFYLNRRSGVTIKNVVVKGWTRGIYPYESDGNNISGNTIQNNLDGIWLGRSDGNNISGNTVRNSSRYGIQLQESGGNDVSGNTVNNNGYGIWLGRSSGNDVSGNTVNNNGWLGIRLQNSSGNDVSGNTVNSFRGIRIWWSDGNRVSGNTMQKNVFSGIRLYEASGNDVSGNTVENTWWGIMLWWSDGNNISGNNINNVRTGISLGDFSWCDNSISGNNIQNNGWGIWLREASSDNISGNNINNSSREGIWLLESDSNNISGNNIQNNGWLGIRLQESDGNNISGNNINNSSREGIRLGMSSGNNISGNNIQNNGWGIWLRESGGNNISGNTVYNSSREGIRLERSGGNTVYHNNIIDNRRQADDTNPATNDWHHPDLLEGNYWSDYPGVDDGSGTGKHAIAGDGIGDTYIPWPGPDYDYYPFIHESGWMDTTPPVTEISLSGTLELEGWWVSDVTMTLTATDDISGVAETAYSFDGVTWITYTESFTITTEGIITVYYNSTDVAGNVEATKSETIEIDKTPPTTDLTIGIHYVDEAGNIYVTSATEFTLTATDDVSGVAHTYYRINNGDWTEYVSAFKLEGPDGPYTIDYYSVDVAGNEETPKSATVILVSLKVNSYLTDSDFNPITYFDLVFVKDKSGGYKLVATNPGQFYHNIEVTNDWSIAVDTLTIDASIPVGFVLKGAVPIHIYLDGNDITDLCTIDGNTITVTNVSSGSMVYVTIHIDYALKGTIYESLDTFEMKSYTFAVTVFGSGGTPSAPGQDLIGTYTSSATLIVHQKKTTAIAGFVTDADGNPIVGATVELFDYEGNLIATTVTDENGLYYFLDIPARDYTVQVTYNVQVYAKTATAVSKELIQVDFKIEYQAH